MLLPTTLVGSYAQPEWLIDRAKLAGRFPPRVRAKELWRIPEPYLAEAQDDATVLAIRAQEEAGLDIVTDGEIRRESYSNRFATALEGIDIDTPGVALDRSGHPNPVPRIVGTIRRKRAVEVDDLKFLRAHTLRKVKMTVPGPFTMSQQAQNDYYPNLADAALDLRRSRQCGDQGPVRGRSRHCPDRRALHAGKARSGAGLWARGAEPGARGRERGHSRAYLLRLRGDHPRAPERLFVPAAAQGLPLPADLDRDGAIRSRLRGPQGIARPVDHPRRARSLDAGRSKRRRRSRRASAARSPTASPRTSLSPRTAGSNICRAMRPSAR